MWGLMRRTLLILAAILSAGALVWLVMPGQGPKPLVQDAQAFVVPGAPKAVMVTLTINNQGPPDRLIDVASQAAKLAILKAPDATGLPIPAAGEASLAMEAGHVMLTGLQNIPVEGSLVPLALTFERSGVIAAKARVSTMAMSHDDMMDVPADQAPRLSMTVQPDGPGWRVVVSATNFRFAPDLVDQPHQIGTGHAHLYVQGIKIGRMLKPEASIGALPPGPHRVRVTLNSNDHKTYAVAGTPIEAEMIVTSR